MAPSGKGRGAGIAPYQFGVDSGEEVVAETPPWDRVRVPAGCVVEVCLQGSSIGLGVKEWFAVLAMEVAGDHSCSWDRQLGLRGRAGEAVCQGGRSSLLDRSLRRHRRAGVGSCHPFQALGPLTVQCLLPEGAAKLKKAIAVEKEARRKETKAPPKSASAKKAAAKVGADRKTKAKPKASAALPAGKAVDDDVIPVGSGDEEPTGAGSRDKLRGILKRTRERILGQAGRPSRLEAAEESAGRPRRAGADRSAREPPGGGNFAESSSTDSSGGSGSGDRSSSSYRDSSEADDKSETESEMSFEGPFWKRAMRDPGSVMTMLVRHAQEQLDRGALLEAVKISTYFALLIRPYHQAGSPILR